MIYCILTALLFWHNLKINHYCLQSWWILKEKLCSNLSIIQKNKHTKWLIARICMWVYRFSFWPWTKSPHHTLHLMVLWSFWQNLNFSWNFAKTEITIWYNELLGIYLRKYKSKLDHSLLFSYFWSKHCHFTLYSGVPRNNPGTSRNF